MPKEKFGGKIGDEETPHAELRWGRESEQVQLSTHPADDDEVESKAWFVTLNRHDINFLIRSLRKARDQAFGADA